MAGPSPPPASGENSLLVSGYSTSLIQRVCARDYIIIMLEYVSIYYELFSIGSNLLKIIFLTMTRASSRKTPKGRNRFLKIWGGDAFSNFNAQ